jgi:hypothetical protein
MAADRSQDSGIPEEGTDSGTSLSPPGLLKPCLMMPSNASEAGSSGIHSDGSSSVGGGDHHPPHQLQHMQSHPGHHGHQQYPHEQTHVFSKRAISVEHLITGQPGSPSGTLTSSSGGHHGTNVNQHFIQQQWKTSSLQRGNISEQQQAAMVSSQQQILADRSVGKTL